MIRLGLWWTSTWGLWGWFIGDYTMASIFLVMFLMFCILRWTE